MNKRTIAMLLKTAFRPVFRGFDDEIEGIRHEASQLTARVARIEKYTGLDRAVDALTDGKGAPRP